MEKNYKVDDILSEIKSRKAKDKLTQTSMGQSTPHEPVKAAKPDFKLQQPEDEQEQTKPQPHAPNVQHVQFAEPAKVRVVEEPQPPPADWKEADGFKFSLPTTRTKKERGENSNPLEFDGHVRSISDKARQRPNRFSSRPKQESVQPPPTDRPMRFDFDFSAPEGQEINQNNGHIVEQSGHQPQQPEEQESPFSAAKSIHFTREHTRKLPKFSTGRDFNIDEIRKMDFDAIAKEMDQNSYYDDEPASATQPTGVTPKDFSEYNSTSDRKEVATDIAQVKLWLILRGAATALLALALVFITFAGKYDFLPLPEFIFPIGDTLPMYYIACTALTILVAVVNSSAMGGGIIALFKMRSNSDTLAAFAMLAAIGQGVAASIKSSQFDPAKLNVYYAVASVIMLFNALGKMTMINRIQSNFKILSSPKEKKALQAVEPVEFCQALFPAGAVRKPTIVYSVKAGFFTDFLSLSYSDKYDVGINRAVAPVCLAGAVIVGACAYFLTGSMLSAIGSVTSILCVCATFSATFIENIPLGKLTKKLAPLGGMVSGNKAVEDFCDTKAIILTESDLFPQGNVQLHAIKAYSKGRIDEAIIDAASVAVAMDGALAPVFLEMINGNRKLLKKVENLVCESGGGVSAWIGSRRMLIGNALLMKTHGVTLPTSTKPEPEVGETLYLANMGELVARFVVTYRIDEKLAVQLDHLAVLGKNIIIQTSDPNLSVDKIWEMYGYPRDKISIMPAHLHEQYKEITTPKDAAMAEIVHTGNASVMVKSILACISARSCIVVATAIALVQVIIGYGLVAFMAFMGTISSVSIVELLVYQTFWFLIIFIFQKARQS